MFFHEAQLGRTCSALPKGQASINQSINQSTNQSVSQSTTAAAEADRYETREEQPGTCTTFCSTDLVIKRPKAG